MHPNYNFDLKVQGSSKNFTIVFEYHGEGYDGDFSTNNPDDRPLLRCDLYSKDDLLEPIRNGSFCTNITLLAPVDKIENLIKEMLQETEQILSEVGFNNLGTISSRIATYSWKADKDL